MLKFSDPSESSFVAHRSEIENADPQSVVCYSDSDQTPKKVCADKLDVERLEKYSRQYKGVEEGLKSAKQFRPYIDPVLIKRIEKRIGKSKQSSLSKTEKIVGISAETVENTYAIILYRDSAEISRLLSNEDDVDNRAKFDRSDLSTRIKSARVDRYLNYGGHPVFRDAAILNADIIDSTWLIDAYLVESSENQEFLSTLRQIQNGQKHNLQSPNLIAILSAERLFQLEKREQRGGKRISEIAEIMKLAGKYLEFYEGQKWSIGIIDNGVDSEHDAFEKCSINRSYDCLSRETGCVQSSLRGLSHGTAVASILNSCAPQHQLEGITNIPIDSYKFPTNDSGDENIFLFIKALEKSVANSNKIVNISQSYGGDRHAVSAVSNAANAAFLAGTVVVAAAGNRIRGPLENVNSEPDSCSTPPTLGSYTRNPAQAALVLAVAASYEFCSDKSLAYKFGITSDNRSKPELKTYTCSQAAVSDDARSTVGVFGGTSGATPFVAGAAALIRAWLFEHTQEEPAPGLVYALLILAGGQNDGLCQPGELPTTGTSGLVLPQTGRMMWGEVELGEGTQVKIPVRNIFPATSDRFDVALWWPDTEFTSPHPNRNSSKVDLEVKNGTEAIVSSKIDNRTFQRTGFDINTDSFSGRSFDLSVNIQAKGVPVATQKVYWAAFLKKRESYIDADTE